MPAITHNQGNEIVDILGEPIGRRLIGVLNTGVTGGNAGPVIPPLINNTATVYTADTNYTKTINGIVVTHLTIAAVQEFWEVTLSLLPKHVPTLRGEGITHPKDLALFKSTEFEMVIRSMKSKAALPGLAQIRLKQARNFF